MADPFIGEIRMFAGTFAPRGWAFCDGQLIAINQYDALFSLLGTNYGGDGETTFGLPDLRGRLPVHPSATIAIGAKAGQEAVTVSLANLPAHTHTLTASSQPAASSNPTDGFLAETEVDTYAQAAADVSMAADAVTSVGGGQAHNNLMPFLCVGFIIALQGVYPSS